MKLLTSKLLIIAGLLMFGSSAAADTIRCESDRGRTQFCGADLRHGVDLVRQLSRAPCRLNDTWGTDRRGIWVSNGCRADFRVGRHTVHRESRRDDSGAAVAGLLALGIVAAIASSSNRDRDDGHWNSQHDQLLRCESDRDRFKRCPVNLRRAEVHIHRRLSRADCRYDRSWGWDQRGVWVDRGCRAEFTISYR